MLLTSDLTVTCTPAHSLSASDKWPDTTDRVSSPFFFLNQHNCLWWPHLMYCHEGGDTFKSQCCIKSFNYLFIFALSRWGIPKTGGLQCDPFRLCLLLPCRVTCVHCSLMSQPGLTWLDSAGHPSAAGFESLPCLLSIISWKISHDLLLSAMHYFSIVTSLRISRLQGCGEEWWMGTLTPCSLLMSALR